MRVFPRLGHDHLAIKLNGKDERLRRADFRTFASTAGLKAADADAAIDEMLGRLREAVGRIALPKDLEYGTEPHKIAKEMLDISRSRIEAFE